MSRKGQSTKSYWWVHPEGYWPLCLHSWNTKWRLKNLLNKLKFIVRSFIFNSFFFLVLFCRSLYWLITRLFSLSTPERSVHSDVRGALGGCSELRLQAHGSDASISQLTYVYGLIAGQDRNTSINIHQSATIDRYIHKLKKDNNVKQNKSLCKFAWSPYCSVKREL